jgi:hypothetical protein
MYKNDVGKGGSKLMNLMKSILSLSLAPTATEARDFKGILGP